MKSKKQKRIEALSRMYHRLEHPVPPGQDRRIKRHTRTTAETNREMRRLIALIGRGA